MATRQAITRLLLYPPTARENEKGHLEIDGCATEALDDLTRYDVL